MEKTTHKILALKYRPKNFKELIGQDIMVETITNSIKLNKLPNAYLLTGIRGVGKTTTARLIAKAINAGREQNIVIVADSQSSSQLGDIGRFVGVTLITPTEREARLAVKDKHGGLVKVAKEVQSLVNSKDVVLTLGSEGVFLRTKRLEFDMWQDDRIPALNRAPKDVAGAGDAFLVGSALATAIGVTVWEAAYVGSMAAACQVGRVGNIPLRVKELTDQLPH